MSFIVSDLTQSVTQMNERNKILLVDGVFHEGSLAPQVSHERPTEGPLCPCGVPR